MKIGSNRPIGFTLVSGLCLIVHNAVMIATDRIGFPLWASVLSSFGVVVLIGYVGHSLVTFGEGMSAVRFGRYAFAMAANIPTAFVLVWIAKNLANLDMIFAAPLATVGSIAMNYILSRWAISPRRVLTE